MRHNSKKTTIAKKMMTVDKILCKGLAIKEEGLSIPNRKDNNLRSESEIKPTLV